jgi:hypothetical protein
MYVSVNGQSVFVPRKVSKLSKLFWAAACFFQEEEVRDALTSCLAEGGRCLGISFSAGRDGIVEYFLALPEEKERFENKYSGGVWGGGGLCVLKSFIE